MKLLIAGSRSIREYDLSPYIPHAVDTIISGGIEIIYHLYYNLAYILVQQVQTLVFHSSTQVLRE